jgi:hypothetical protein
MNAVLNRLKGSWILLLLAVALWFPQGCMFGASMGKAMSQREPLEWPSDMQRIQVDRAASSLTYSIDERKLPNDTQWLVTMRSHIARGIESTANPSGAPIPIRFKAEVHGTSEFVFFTKCILGIGWVYWGCPDHVVYASANITLDIDGRLYHGAGHAEDEVHLIWYNTGKVTDTEIAAYAAIIEATRAALESTPHAGLITNLEKQLARMTLPATQRRRAP